MASISTNNQTGHRRILFIGADGKRRQIHLGKLPKKAVESIKTKVEALNAASIAKISIDKETADWLGGLDARLYDKLAASGLVPKRPEPARSTLGAFLNAYIASRTDIKPLTRDHLNRVRVKLIDFFGAEKPMAAVAAGDADEFRTHLLETMSENTVRRICGRAKQFFRAAARKRLISESPFADMKDTCVRANKSRDFYLSREMADRVLSACPDAQWRLLFALSRYGGLRCPSEHLGPRWGDIDWERGRMTVRSPKTEHHQGKGSRVIPIFPELRAHLEQVWDEAKPGSEYVITRYRAKNSNLRTQLERIIGKAGLKPWPKLFQNLRSTRETELTDQFPIHVVCSWIGNSEVVARKHYLQVTDEHFEQAGESGAESGAAS